MGKPQPQPAKGHQADKVAVIGAGPAGMASLKELREVGFHVTAFERRSDVGGIFTFDADPSITSATHWTRSQLSKYVCPMTDFPFPDNMSVHVSSDEWSEYYRQYARHFKLYDHIVFNTTIEAIRRDDRNSKWLIHIKGEAEPKVFDRVVFSTGSETIAMKPRIKDLENFRGQFLHGQAYKSPADFQDKNVIVLGMGNSACDTASELTEYAAKVYLAHRRGAKIIPRANEDGPLDSYISWKISRMALWAEHHTPGIFQIVADGLLQKNSDKHFHGEKSDHQIEWMLEQSSRDVTTIICNDHLKELVYRGRIASVRGVKRIAGPRAVELENGEILEDIDAIIACTGYRADFSLLPDLPRTQVDEALPSFPDLYQNVFPPKYADSLACTNYCIINDSAAAYRELQAMAIAQVWAGKSVLPSEEAMMAQVTEYQAWLAKQMKAFPATILGKGQVFPWMKWLHETAGTGLYEYMGCGLKGWSFWLRDRKLYNLVAWGVYSPHIYRLFHTGKRAAWAGAREAIIQVNEERERAFPKVKKGKA